MSDADNVRSVKDLSVSQSCMSLDESDEESHLGKHEHWEDTYAKELENFNDHGNQGEIWQVQAQDAIHQIKMAESMLSLKIICLPSLRNF